MNFGGDEGKQLSIAISRLCLVVCLLATHQLPPVVFFFFFASPCELSASPVRFIQQRQDMQLFHPLGFFFSPLPKFRKRELSHFPRGVASGIKSRDKIWTSKFTGVSIRNICSINTSSPSWAGRSWSRRYSNCRNSCSWTWSSRRICCKRRTRRRRPPRFNNWRFNSNVWYSNCRSRRANIFFNRVWVFRVTILLQVSAEFVLDTNLLVRLLNYYLLKYRIIHITFGWYIWLRTRTSKTATTSKVSRCWPSDLNDNPSGQSRVLPIIPRRIIPPHFLIFHFTLGETFRGVEVFRLRRISFHRCFSFWRASRKRRGRVE